MSEHTQQVAVFKWAHDNEDQWPDLRWLYAVPNGGGPRFGAIAKKMQAEGLKPGVPDMVLPVPRGTYHGLYLEMKDATKGSTSDKQDEWLAALKGFRYYVAVAHGADIAIQILTTYIQWAPTQVVSELHIEIDRFVQCRNAATVLPMRRCKLEEGHEGSCVPDDRPRIPKL